MRCAGTVFRNPKSSPCHALRPYLGGADSLLDKAVVDLNSRPPFETSSGSDSYLDPDTEPDVGQDSDSEGKSLW
jgi:hypothetical protein